MTVSKEIRNNVITAVVTAVVLGVLGWAAGVFKAGSAALDEVQIEAAIQRAMITDSGETYGQLLNSMDKSVGEINVSIGHIQGDIARIDTAVGALAAE
jgi:hypothetical protein